MVDTDMDTTVAWAWGRITMNPTGPFTVAGDLVTLWGRFATVDIDGTVVAAIRMLSDPRPNLTGCRLFRRVRGLVTRGRDRIKVEVRPYHAVLSIVFTIYTIRIIRVPCILASHDFAI